MHPDIYRQEEGKESLLNINIISKIHFDQNAECIQKFTDKRKERNLYSIFTLFRKYISTKLHNAFRYLQTRRRKGIFTQY